MNQQQLDELSAVMSLTSDRVITAWNAITEMVSPICFDLGTALNGFYRSLYAAGIVNTPLSRHPMTARKMRGAIRRLKAGAIGVKR